MDTAAREMTTITKSDTDVASAVPPEPPKKQNSDIPSSHDEEAAQPASSVVQQEEVANGGEGEPRFRRRDILCLALICIAGLSLFIGLLSLALWVSTLIRPTMYAETLEVESFSIREGTDANGVPTKLVSVKCSFKIYVYNTVKTYGIRVRSNPVDLFYKDIAVAHGELRGFYLSWQQGRTASVYLVGEKVPLHEAGADFPLNSTGGAVPLRLELDVVTRGHVVGRLVMSKHSRHVSCSINLDFATITKPIKLGRKTCKYS